MDIHFFDDELERFIQGLEKSSIAKILRTLDLLEKFGNKLGMPHSKPLKDGLFELRIRGVQEIRIIYVFHKRSVVLLHGFSKKTQKLPVKHLNIALGKKNQIDNT